MMGKPKIRFKGYNEDWEQRKLGEICSRVQGNDGRMELPTLTISAANGWMKQEDRFSGNIAGKEQKNYTLLHKGELSYNHGNSKLAKYGTVFSLQTYEEALVPRVYHSFKVEIGSADFIEYYFATKMPDRELRKLISSGARMDGLLNIGYDDFMGIKMMFPSVLEQDKIAECFRAFDHLITLHQRKIYIFIKKMPIDWEQRKFAELAEYKKGPFGSAITKSMFVPKSDDSVKVYEQQNAINKDWSLERYFLPKEYAYTRLKAFEVHSGDIIVSCAGTIGEIYEIPDNAEYGVINQALMRVRVYEKIVDKRMFIIAFSNMINEFTRTHSNGSAIKNIPPFADLKPMKVLMPSMEEQRVISECFEKIDYLITLHQHKCDETKKLKKCMLQKMFPKNGKKVPEIRFDGFANDWEQRKLNEVAEFNPKSDLPESFEYVDLESVVGTEMVSHRTESKETAPSRAQRLAQTGDVFFQTVRPYQRNNYLQSLIITMFSLLGMRI